MMDLKRVNEYMARVAASEQRTFPACGKKLKVGLDLGTAYIVLVVLDEEDNPVACEKQAAEVLKDGVVVDYHGALSIVKALKERLESRLGTELTKCAIAMPAGTESSARTHQYIAEGAGFEVTQILDEPTAANSVYQIENGAVVDIGGGTTGLALFRDGAAVKIYAEPIVRPVIQKMATIAACGVGSEPVEAFYLCGGTSCLTGLEKVFEKASGIKTVKPDDPFLVTPAGIAMNCRLS